MSRAIASSQTVAVGNACAATLKSNTTFAVAFAICFPFAFIFTRYMEDAHYFGRVGLGAALLMASTFAAIIAGLVSVAFLLIARRRKRSADHPRE